MRLVMGLSFILLVLSADATIDAQGFGRGYVPSGVQTDSTSRPMSIRPADSSAATSSAIPMPAQISLLVALGAIVFRGALRVRDLIRERESKELMS